MNICRRFEFLISEGSVATHMLVYVQLSLYGHSVHVVYSCVAVYYVHLSPLTVCSFRGFEFLISQGSVAT